MFKHAPTCTGRWPRTAACPQGVATIAGHAPGNGPRTLQSVGRVAIIVGLGAVAGPWTEARASCKAPLPTASLRSLDAMADSDPAAAVAASNQRLALAPPGDAFMRAQLYVIIADAQDTIDDDPAARDAVMLSRQQLDRLPTSPESARLRLRLTLIEGDGLQTAESLAAGAATLDALERTVPDQSLEHACLLLTRSRIEGRLTHQDLAAAAAVAAYRIASDIGSGGVAADAAYELATTYRRAGLIADALRMVEEAITYTRAERHLAALANALWEKARILGDAGQYQTALGVLAESTELSERLKDATGIAFDNQERCNELLGLQQIDAAQHACRDAEQAFSALGREDQRLITQAYLVRIDIIRGRPGAALARLNPALGSESEQVPPRVLSSLYGERAEVLSRLGRDRQAFQDLTQSMQIDARANKLQRSLAAAALSVQLQIERIEQQKRTLERTVLLERELGARRATTTRLSLGIAVASVALSALLVAWLWTRSRHQRAMRRATETLETHARVIHTVREGVLLVDDHGRIEYTNPALLHLLGRDGDDLSGMGLDAIGLAADTPPDPAGAPPDEQRDGGAEVHVRSRDGDELTLLLTRATLALERRSVHIYVLQDVTERRRLEREVLELASAERDRLSNEVHDGLGQELTGIALLLRSVVSSGHADHATLEMILGHVNEAIRHARTVAHSLAPVQIAGGALDVALVRLAADLSETWPVRVVCSANLAHLRLAATEADHLYRIAHEAITNAMRHSGCKTIRVDLAVLQDDVALTVTDDGVGLDASDGGSRGLGMRTMAYRAHLLRGSMRVERPASGGLRIAVLLPLRNLEP